MELERTFEAPPEQVFSAFLAKLETVGQLERWGDFGSAATFRMTHSLPHPAPTLLAQVRPADRGAVLQVARCTTARGVV